MENHAVLLNVLTYLGSAIIMVPIFRRLGLGSVLGYIAAGSLIGPFGFRLISDVERIMHFSEIGVVLLLFSIGLELSLKRLWVMRRSVFGIGSAQVVVTSSVLGLIAYGFGFSPLQAFLIGACLSLSSTAFVLQTLSERDELNMRYGRSAFGILLFQDLAAIPLLALVPLLATPQSTMSPHSVFEILKAFVLLVLFIVIGSRLIEPALRFTARVRMREVFTAAALFVVFGTALLMESVGLSMALGAFIAGLILAESEHRHELKANVEPFEGLLLGLFFISVGMSVDYALMFEKPALVLALMAGLLAVKGVILLLIGRVSKLPLLESGRLAVILSQGGEFGFVVLSAAVGEKLIAPGLKDLLNLVITLSMAATPLLVQLYSALSKRAGSKTKKADFDAIEGEENEVIIAGFGRMGQIVGRMLRVRRIPFTALDSDPEQVRVLRRFGNKVYYGDASRIDLLEAAGARSAKYFVLAIRNFEVSMKTVKIVLEKFPHLKIYARARNRQHAFELMALGINVLYRETLGTSLELASDLLKDMGFDPDQVSETVRRFRDHDEEALKQQFERRNNEKQLIEYSKQYAQQLSDLFEKDHP